MAIGLDILEQSGGPRPSVAGRRNEIKAGIGIAICLAVLFAVGSFALGSALSTTRDVIIPVNRIDGAFAGLRDRPTKPSAGGADRALNILLMGVDSRSEVATTGNDAQAPEWVAGEQRTDTLMLLHIDRDRRGASLISVPRDAWVQVPGHGTAKINAAFSLAGPSLAVATFERLTEVRIDHLVVLDWEGFRAMTDALGGVTIDIPATVHDSARDITWTAGSHLLDGEQALNYVRQRYGLPLGDIDRVRRQQSFLRAVTDKFLASDVSKDPVRLHHLLKEFARHASVDAGWSTVEMARLALSLADLRSSAIRYMTVPVKGFGREGAQSVVYLDPVAGEDLWRAVRYDRVAPWAEDHPEAATPRVVR